MNAYISISYSKRKILDTALCTIINTLKQFKIEPLVFVDVYQFNAKQERQMMQQAFAAIDQCDILVAEASDKAIGIGVEVGYAKAKGKPVIYIRHTDRDHSSTVSGVSDFHIFYIDVNDLHTQLTHIAQQLIVTYIP